MKKKIGKVLCLVGLLGSCVLFGLQAKAGTIYDSPYVSFSPDGKGWTVQAGETDYTQYPEGTTVSTGITSSLRGLETGEHYYRAPRSGTVPIGRWEVNHRASQCIHDGYPSGDYLGLDYRKANCFEYYNSGWFAYCADCGDEIIHMLVYMTKEAAETIDYMDCGMEINYYHLCPYCNNLEQGREVSAHECKAISWNQYLIKYEKNDDFLPGFAEGYMIDSIHMYNNANVYEGRGVTPVTRLSRNAYSCTGYEFMGWNTEPDGSGAFYEDCAEIYNLTPYDFHEDEERGIITLYAQWKQSESTLEIEPNGGSYGGSSEVTSVTQAYMTKYSIDNGSIIPPEGYTVSFETNGGSRVSDITCTQHFTEWSRGYPFAGRLTGAAYLFLASDGNTDIIVANYAPDSIRLPETEKENFSFGGWYYDETFTRPAGGAGDRFTPTQDRTLYAQWVELKLYAEDNYTDNEKKGAVDLSWTQNDHQGKAYKLYQSLDGEDWKQINSALDVGTELLVKEEFAYSGTEQTYTVPYSGRYTLSAYGAQGGNYGSFQGGKGGNITGTFWLSKGDILTITVGGQNGYGGGGTGTVYGCGGGSTTISSAQHGLLLTAGGGGGATSLGNGWEGGSLASLRTDGKSPGADGQAGGGGGHVGGNAGEAVIHKHTADCYQTENINLISKYGVTTLAEEEFYYFEGRVYDDDDNFDEDDDYDDGVIRTKRIGSPKNLIPVESGQNLKLQTIYGATDFGTFFYLAKSGISIYNQNGTKIHSYTAGQLESWVNQQRSIAKTGAYNNAGDAGTYTFYEQKHHAHDDDGEEYIDSLKFCWLEWKNGSVYRNRLNIDVAIYDSSESATVLYEHYWKNSYNAEALFYPEIIYGGTQYYGARDYIFRENYTIPEGTTGIYIEMTGAATQHWDSDPKVNINIAQLTGSRLKCGYAEGQIISSKPAYGGSNYANPEVCTDYQSTAGTQEGNGSFLLEAKDIGFFEDMSLSGVAANDLAAPKVVQTSGIHPGTGERALRIEPVEGSNGSAVKVTWTEPEDLGTTYYHKVESHMAFTGTKLCVSNITENTLITGVKGYYYVIDTETDTTVTAANAAYMDKDSPFLEISLTEADRYLHIAAVDVAGNVGETGHVRIGTKQKAEVEWPLYTMPLALDGEDNVHPAEEEATWYVRCDDATPFTLEFEAYMEGSATEEYQINHMAFISQPEGCEEAANNVEVPRYAIQAGTIETTADGLIFSNSGAPVLRNDTYIKTIHSNFNQNITITNEFLADEQIHGKKVRITPGAGVVTAKHEVYTNTAADRENSIYIIGDLEAPVIEGMEALDGVEVIDRSGGAFILNLQAQDSLSGVREFYVEIHNTDNESYKTWQPDASGMIQIDLTAESPIFSGDFSVTAVAVDNVGNESREMYQVTEFALETEVTRILAPHEPVFQRGESGVLSITTWGYVERVEVEFPESLTDLDDSLNGTYTYDLPRYRQEEQQQFMIPLYVPEDGEYTITVRAYKGGRNLEAYPETEVIKIRGTVLDEIRTRLR